MSLGIFDSGVGGLGVLRQVRELVPTQAVTYVADQGRAPYGARSLDDVRSYADQLTTYLIEDGAEVVVVACNSASAAALYYLRDRYPDTRFVGMEPAVKPAATASRSGRIGVLATNTTFQGELFATVVDRHAGDVTVLTQACPGLAQLVEDGITDGPEARALLAAYVTPLVDEGIDALALGCTHYTFLTPLIRELVGPGVDVIDPAPAVARQIARVLAVERAGPVTYVTTGDPARFAAAIFRFMGLQVPVTTMTPADWAHQNG